jgi:phosphatidylglycerophosphate synthase
MINCQRVGINRFFLQPEDGRRDEIDKTIARMLERPDVSVVGGISDLDAKDGLDASAAVAMFTGNLVFSKSHLARVVADFESDRDKVVRLTSADADHGGEIAIGQLANLRNGINATGSVALSPLNLMPFALNGRPEDRVEAELRLARALRDETAQKDAPLARMIDRKLSWRISYRLANTAITPNQVTLANTAMGLLCAWMFSVPSYWMRLGAALIFLLSVTIDGVDGELARLKMCETDFGGKLDVFTDNIVHTAVFIGLFAGCYRASDSRAYLILIPIVLGGFALCTLATWYAFTMRGTVAATWLDRVDRWTGRDFAYLLVVLATINRLEWFAWGAAFGTYVFAGILTWLAATRIAVQPEIPQEGH